MSTSGGPVLSIAAALIVATGVFLALTEVGFLFEGLLALFFGDLLRAFYFFVAILTW